MKNLKNMLMTGGLMAVMGISAVSANAGIILTDKSAEGTKPCSVKETGIIQQVAGIVLNGLMLSDLHGIILTDAATAGCDQGTNGLMISDRNGLMISD